MPLITHGSISSGITRKITYNKTTTGNQKIEEIVSTWANREAVTPKIGTESGGYTLTNAIQEQQDAETCKITLTWENTIADTEEGEDVPSDTYDEDTSYVELDIRQHPKWESDFQSHWDDDQGEFRSTSPYYGITSYIVGTTVVTKTQYFASQPASLYESVGTLSTPGGGFTGTNKWLIIGTSRRKVGDQLFVRETRYLYSAKEYNTTIYS